MLGLILLASATSILCLGCARKCSPPSRTLEGAGVGKVKAAEASQNERAGADGAVTGPEEAAPDASYADAIRRRDFATAASAIDAAPAEERARPEVRYARALVALELRDSARALAEVAHLSASGPAFAARADQITLRVAKQTRDATVLGHLLSQPTTRAKPEDRLLLAEVLIESGQAKEGGAVLGELLRQLELEKSSQEALLAEARATRAALRRQLGQNSEAAEDYFWLATSAVGQPVADGADQLAERLNPARRLTKDQRLARARRLSELGRIEAVDEELRRLTLAPGTPPVPQALTFVRGWAVYASRSDYPAAARLFAQAAGESGTEKAKCLYYQAKALARSAEHARAIDLYRKVARLGGPYVEPASYEAVRLLHLSGDWQGAIVGYERYLRQFPKGAHRSSVEGDLPVVRLAAGGHRKARQELAALVKKTSDARERSRLLELEGVAALGQKDTKSALALFARVIAEQPLTLPALLAERRMRTLGATPPPVLPPATGRVETAPLPHLHLPDLAERLHRVGLDEEAEQALKAEEPALEARFGARAPEVLCRLYAQLESAMRRYQVAQTATKMAALFQEPTTETAWQWACIYPRPYADIVAQEAKRRAVSSSFVYGVMRQESSFRPAVVSSARAVGLMQIIPPTAAHIARELGVPYQPEAMVAPAINIEFGVYYLGKLLEMFQQRPELAAAAYNAGPRALSRWLQSLSVLPLDLFLASIPYEETRNYVYRVMSNYARYAYLAGEPLPEVRLELPQGLLAPPDAY